MLKVYKANKVLEKHSKEFGTLEIDKEKMVFYCKNGSIEITEMQLEGKRRMPTSDFLKGYKH